MCVAEASYLMSAFFGGIRAPPRGLRQGRMQILLQLFQASGSVNSPVPGLRTSTPGGTAFSSSLYQWSAFASASAV